MLEATCLTLKNSHAPHPTEPLAANSAIFASTQWWARVGLQLGILETQTLFLYYYLIIILSSTQITTTYFCPPLYIYLTAHL